MTCNAELIDESCVLFCVSEKVEYRSVNSIFAKKRKSIPKRKKPLSPPTPTKFIRFGHNGSSLALFIFGNFWQKRKSAEKKEIHSPVNSEKVDVDGGFSILFSESPIATLVAVRANQQLASKVTAENAGLEN